MLCNILIQIGTYFHDNVRNVLKCELRERRVGVLIILERCKIPTVIFVSRIVINYLFRVT